MLSGFVAEWGFAAWPAATIPDESRLVPQPIGSNLPLELGESEEDVHDQTTHAVGRVEVLRDRHEGDMVALEDVHQAQEVEQAPGDAVELVDQNYVDQSVLDIRQQIL